MSEHYLRTWKKFEIEKVKEHLLNIGDSLGNCENCKELGLDYKTVSSCPNCETVFKYMTSKNATGNQTGRVGVVKRLQEIRQDLEFIDYDDFKANFGRSQAKDIFKD